MLYQQGGLALVFAGCAALCALWFVVAFSMREPPYVTSLRLPLSAGALANAGLGRDLLQVAGVSDVLIVADEAAAYIKVDTQQLDREALDRLVA